MSGSKSYFDPAAQFLRDKQRVKIHNSRQTTLLRFIRRKPDSFVLTKGKGEVSSHKKSENLCEDHSDDSQNAASLLRNVRRLASDVNSCEKDGEMQILYSEETVGNSEKYENNRVTSGLSPVLIEPSRDDDTKIDHSKSPLGGVSMKTLIERSASLRPFKRKLRIDSESDNASDDDHGVQQSAMNGVVEESCSDEISSCNSQKHGDSSCNSSIDMSKLDMYLKTLQQLFPDMDKMEIYDILRSCDYDVTETVTQLNKTLTNKACQTPDSYNSKNDLEDINKYESKKKKRELKEERIYKIKRSKKKLKIENCEIEDEVVIEEDEENFIGKLDVYNSDEDSDGDLDDINPEVDYARNCVVTFFNDAIQQELLALPKCSLKKAENIISMKPYENWIDLVYKFKTSKLLHTELLNSAKDILLMRDEVQKLLKKCENISSKMKSSVSRILCGEEDSSLAQQPAILNQELSLKTYQLIGLNWLLLMHYENLNGVLADEMGLGKTIQAIAFLAYLKETENVEKYSLIIVPSSTLDNWARELELWCPSLSVVLYHGSQEERRPLRIAILNNAFDEDVDIILTTYNMVTSNPEDKALFKKILFETVIFDEAHFLKNMATQRYENLMRIKACRRILLTGTPLQNSLVELMSLLVFVMPQFFHSKKEILKQVFSTLPKKNDQSEIGYEKEKIEQAKNIMKPFILRRLKVDVLKDLPKKSEKLMTVAMTENQKSIYQSTVKKLSDRAKEIKLEIEEMKMKDLTELEELESMGSPKKTVLSSNDSGAGMLMILRRMANHPLLVRRIYNDAKLKTISQILKKSTHKDAVLQYVYEDLSVMSDFEIHKTCQMYKLLEEYVLSNEAILDSGKFRYLDEVLPRMKEAVLDILEEYLKICGFNYLRLDGSTQVIERQGMIDEFNSNDNIFIFILSTRAGGLGINLTAANYVILHDIDFNPYTDKQAEDRCHRVGQKRSVTVTKLISANTIEEGMLQIASKKLELEQEVTGRNDDRHKKGEMVTLLKEALGLHSSDTLN